MVLAMIVTCEVAFWVLLGTGLALRYRTRLRRTSAAVLLVEPVLEVALLVVTAVDLRDGGHPDWQHGLAALYIGYTVAYGRYTLRWLDGHAAHRLADGPRPPKPPRYGAPRAVHEAKLWLRTLLMAAVALALLQLAIWYVGDSARTVPLAHWRTSALTLAGIHGVIALSYTLFPKRQPRGGAGNARR
ncbi:hypothetical protein [Streptomyces montanisoli]|uniref:Integral membrane protein n=1 Tax=Streptomyces montanisoli TaxID=2798581 RepID=A0A940RUY0_9ACTN|nr:hypothetical protein [Streptomyces montanisoli]MBP0457690.1 hypothetical protein [Streptomyces montanisoli]